MCERCFKVATEVRDCCQSDMVECNAGEPGSPRSQPLYSADGELRSHAPRWWLERRRDAERR